MNKCEWCEERRYTLLGNKETGKVYCMELEYDKENNPRIEISMKKVPSFIWEIKYTKNINYCPFCGKYLRGDSNE